MQIMDQPGRTNDPVGAVVYITNRPPGTSVTRRARGHPPRRRARPVQPRVCYADPRSLTHLAVCVRVAPAPLGRKKPAGRLTDTFVPCSAAAAPASAAAGGWFFLPPVRGAAAGHVAALCVGALASHWDATRADRTTAPPQPAVPPSRRRRRRRLQRSNRTPEGVSTVRASIMSTQSRTIDPRRTSAVRIVSSHLSQHAN